MSGFFYRPYIVFRISYIEIVIRLMAYYVVSQVSKIQHHACMSHQLRAISWFSLRVCDGHKKGGDSHGKRNKRGG